MTILEAAAAAAILYVLACSAFIKLAIFAILWAAFKDADRFLFRRNRDRGARWADE